MLEEISKEIEERCNNPLETQETIAQSYAKLLRHTGVISPERIARANAAIKARYPSKSGFLRVKKLAWAIIEKRENI